MNSHDQAAGAENWRSRLRNMRTIPGLRAGKPDHGALAPLDAEALSAAAENPDHSQAGRAAAAAAARTRGLALQRWRIVVPGFISAVDLADGERLFFGWGRVVRVWSGRLVFSPLLAMLALAVFAEASPPTDRAFAEHAIETVWAPLIGGVMLIALVVWFFASALRRRPARIVLLRKFNVRALSAPLERMIGRELRPYGHIASLSDKHVKADAWGWLSSAILSLSNPLAGIWFVIGAPFRFIWRLFDRSRMGPATVIDARDYRNLARRLRDRIGLNVQVASASKDAFLVRTSDAWWRLVVRLLMDSADALVVDLSQVSEGTAWELDAIRDENASARCVFVALWDKREDAQAALTRWGFANACFPYTQAGEMRQHAEFRAAMLAAMRATHQV